MDDERAAGRDGTGIGALSVHPLRRRTGCALATSERLGVGEPVSG
ncbi:hypothetical protein [Kocuria rosea]|nr:hypothetical protein [Kocuria rosea]MEB2619326.1 hypothetical protein [Kocuria rosea]